MASFKRFMRRFVPTPWTVIILVLWLGMALISAHVIGAYLSPKLGSPEKVTAISLGLTIGLPILIAPRPTWEPAGWGLAMNLVAFLALGIFGRYTQDAIQAHGDWAVNWTVREDFHPKVQELARRVTDATAWLLSIVPIERLEAELGLSREDYEWKARDSLSVPGMESLQGTLDSSNKSEEELSETVARELREQLARANDGESLRRAIQTPDREEVRAMEHRLRTLIDLERARLGLTPLSSREDLSKVARAHVIAMQDQGFYGHIDPEGRDPKARAREAHLSNSSVNEVIARAEEATDAPRELFNAMLKEPSERLRLFGDEAEYSSIGLAITCQGPVCLATVLLM